MQIGSHKGVKYAVTFSKEKFDKIVTFSLAHWKILVGALAVLLLCIALAGCDIGVSDNPQPTATAPCPSVIEGTIDAPPMADRVTALAIEAKSKGLTLTGDYTTDYSAQGGEMILLGSYRFQFDEKCGVAGDSWMKLFNDDKYPITGGMAGDGTLGMDANFGGAIVNIRGRVVDGKLQDGRAIKSWLPHIYGILNGTWRAV